MSQISLTFQFDTLHHLTAFLQLVTPHTALRAANVAVSPVEAAPPAPVVDLREAILAQIINPHDSPVVAAAPKAKRGRPRKTKTPDSPPIETKNSAGADVRAPVLAVEQTPAVVLSKDSVLAALQGMHDHLVSLSPTPEAGKKSALQACIDLLTRYGATRFGEVLPEQYPKFMADIVDMRAGKDIAAASLPDSMIAS